MTKIDPAIRPALLWLTVLWLALVAVRLTGPPDLVTRDQGLSMAYMVDIVDHGAWFSAQDHLGAPASKPPLHNWLGAVSVLLLGRSWFAMALPSVLATLATTWFLVVWGARRLSPRVGALAGFAFLTCHLTVALLTVIRPDALLVLLVALASAFAFDAWRGTTTWWPFWITASLAVLAKGPLGLVFPACGLTAAVWMRRDGEPRPERSPSWPGAVLFVVVCAGVFALSWSALGQAFIDEVIGDELIGHAFSTDDGRPVIATFWQPSLYLLGRFLPWSVALLPALWRVVRRPAGPVEQRALERFLAMGLLIGVVVLSLIGHKRGDLVAPLMPAAALLTGRELARWTRGWSGPLRTVATVTATAAILTTQAWYHHSVRPSRDYMRKSTAHLDFGRLLADRVSDPDALAFTTYEFSVQLAAGTLTRTIPLETAAERLADARPFWVVTARASELARIAAARGADVHVVLRGDLDLALLSNRSGLP